MLQNELLPAAAAEIPLKSDQAGESWHAPYFWAGFVLQVNTSADQGDGQWASRQPLVILLILFWRYPPEPA